jgi:hypothetical protein
VKIILINDTHCGVRNSSDVFIEQQRKFYEELMFPYMKEHGIKNIIHLGDYYETRKFINFKALNANRKHFLEPLREYGYHMDIFAGNHDVFFKNTNDLCSLKELMGHYYNEVTIHMDPTVKSFDGCNIALLPWINVDNYHRSLEFIQKCEASVLCGHLELTGFEMMKGIMNTHGMEASIFERFEHVFSGHFHTKSSQGNITYLGAQFETTWADCDDPKYFHVFDTETRTLTPIRNPEKMFVKVVYKDNELCYNESLSGRFVKVIVVEKSDPFMFDRFMDSINKQNPVEVKIAETFSEFEGSSIDDDSVVLETTTDLLNSYVEAVDTELDKDKIKNIMKTLYVQAVNEDVV